MLCSPHTERKGFNVFKLTDETCFSFSENVIGKYETIEECFSEIANALECGSDRFEIDLPNGKAIEVDARYSDFGSWD